MGLLCGVFGTCDDSGLFDYPIMAVSAYFETAIPALVRIYKVTVSNIKGNTVTKTVTQ